MLSRQQQDGESVDEFMHALDSLSNECNFKEVSADVCRDEFVRDSFIRGLKCSEIRQRLLEECNDRTQTFSKARTLELAVKNNQMIGGNSMINAVQSSTDVSASMRKSGPLPHYGNSNICFYCDNQKHNRQQCPARNVICFSCGIKGHFAKCCRCRSNPGYRQNSTKPNVSSCNGETNKKVQSTAASVPHSNQVEASESYLSALTPCSLSDAIINAKVSGNHVKVLIDSGSTESYINSIVVSNLGLTLNNTEQQNVRMASKSHIVSTLGTVSTDLELAGHTHKNIKLQVMENLCTDVIIGHDVLNQHEKLILYFGSNRSPIYIDNVVNLVLLVF